MEALRNSLDRIEYDLYCPTEIPREEFQQVVSNAPRTWIGVLAIEWYKTDIWNISFGISYQIEMHY